MTTDPPIPKPREDASGPNGNEEIERVETPERFGPSEVKNVHETRRYQIQTNIGVVLAATALICLLFVVVTACYLALNGHPERIGPLAQALQPFLLPLLGGIAGYAFGKQERLSTG
jgi:hypothetical protein